jgi:hypothetical protein
VRKSLPTRVSRKGTPKRNQKPVQTQNVLIQFVNRNFFPLSIAGIFFVVCTGLAIFIVWNDYHFKNTTRDAVAESVMKYDEEDQNIQFTSAGIDPTCDLNELKITFSEPNVDSLLQKYIYTPEEAVYEIRTDSTGDKFLRVTLSSTTKIYNFINIRPNVKSVGAHYNFSAKINYNKEAYLKTRQMKIFEIFAQDFNEEKNRRISEIFSTIFFDKRVGFHMYHAKRTYYQNGTDAVHYYDMNYNESPFAAYKVNINFNPPYTVSSMQLGSGANYRNHTRVITSNGDNYFIGRSKRAQTNTVVNPFFRFTVYNHKVNGVSLRDAYYIDIDDITVRGCLQKTAEF